MAELRRAAIVLEGHTTSLAAARALHDSGLEVTVLSLSDEDLCRGSRAFETFAARAVDSPEDLLAQLEGLGRRFQLAPFLLPCSDEAALFCAEHRERLERGFLVWNNELEALRALIGKERLYARAVELGLPVPPGIRANDRAALEAWLGRHSGPYLCKPSYRADERSDLDHCEIVSEAQAVLALADRVGGQGLLVQEQRLGGDGHVYDCYGLCDGAHRIRALATHRRLRQQPAHSGATSYGEIPAGPPALERRLIELTERLFAGLPFHGIFGVEWLHDTEHDALYLLDVNARVFSSVGHLAACGMNLPRLAFDELCGQLDVAYRPRLEPKRWVDMARDLESFRSHHDTDGLTLVHWLGEVLRAESRALWRIDDPGPGLRQFARVSNRLVRGAVRRIGLAPPSRKPAEASRWPASKALWKSLPPKRIAPVSSAPPRRKP